MQVLRQGSDLGEEELIQWCKYRIAKYKVPKYVVFLNVLPKTAVGNNDNFSNEVK
ncbi:AMP-binding enzyme [Cytobacillus depressus]|uniref:AMP-binding enzyme n=1 Tax=Cytobacillus depressus TaxID=1602942 RepID=UPI003CCDBF1E